MKKRGFGAGKFNGKSNQQAAFGLQQTNNIGFGGKVEKGETIEEGARRELLVRSILKIKKVFDFMCVQTQEEAEIEAIDLERVGMLMFTFEKDLVGLETHIFVTTLYKGSPQE